MNVVNIPVTMDELVALWKLRHGVASRASYSEFRARTREIPAPGATTQPPLVAPATGKFPYAILGERRHAKSAVAAYIDILTALARLEPSLPERLSRVAPTNTRNHIARSAAEVYPGRLDLAMKSHEFAPGWYAGVNISNDEKRRLLRLACICLELQFGKDVVLGTEGR